MWLRVEKGESLPGDRHYIGLVSGPKSPSRHFFVPAVMDASSRDADEGSYLRSKAFPAPSGYRSRRLASLLGNISPDLTIPAQIAPGRSKCFMDIISLNTPTVPPGVKPLLTLPSADSPSRLHWDQILNNEYCDLL